MERREEVRAARLATPVDDQCRRGESEEYPVGERDPIEQIAVAPREHQRDGPGTLQRDRGDGRARARMQHRERPKEYAIARHGLIDPRRDEDDEVQEPGGGDRDAHRDDPSPCLAELESHHVGGRRSTCGESLYAQCVEVGEVGEQVCGSDDQHADDQRARQVTARIDHLLGDEVGLLPATVREEHGNERRADRDGDGEETLRNGERCGDDGRGRRYGSIGDEESDDDQHRDRGELEDGEHVLHHGARRDAEDVDHREDADRRDRERRFGARPESEERHRVVRERDGDGSGGTTRDREQQRPSVQECRQRTERVAQIRVSAARRGRARAELGEYERPQYRDHGAEPPGEHRVLPGAYALRDDGRVEEHSRPDDPADDEERTGEDPDATRVRGHWGMGRARDL